MPLSPHLLRQPFLPFLASLFFVSLADSMMSYAFPVLVENSVHSLTMLGIIMAASSIVGITCDALFPQWFRPHTWARQLLLTIVIAAGFPLLTHVGGVSRLVVFFLIGSVVWGIYYELLYFSQQNFVLTKVHRQDVSRTWGFISLLVALGSFLAPIVTAPMLLHTNSSLLVSTLALLALSLLFYAFVDHKGMVDHPESHGAGKRLHLFAELQAWKVLLPRVTSVIAMGVLTKAVDATMWTLAALFGIALFATPRTILGLTLTEDVSWIPMLTYQVPIFFGSALLMKLKIHEHKKRFSELFLLISGLALLPFFLWNNQLWALPLLFVAGFGTAMALPLNQAVYTDLMKRAHGYEEDIVGLAQTNASFAYIFVPLIAGTLAEKIGYAPTFGALGAFLIVAMLVLLITTPRKIHLPQTAMQELKNDGA